MLDVDGAIMLLDVVLLTEVEDGFAIVLALDVDGVNLPLDVVLLTDAELDTDARTEAS